MTNTNDKHDKDISVFTTNQEKEKDSQFGSLDIGLNLTFTKTYAINRHVKSFLKVEGLDLST